MPGRPDKYTGVWDCFRQTVAEEGFGGLYRGIGPNFLKSVPAMAISYAVFEWTKRSIMALDARLSAAASTTEKKGTRQQGPNSPIAQW